MIFNELVASAQRRKQNLRLRHAIRLHEGTVMTLDSALVRSMGEMIGLEIPESDLEAITIRLGELLSAMDDIERELGPEMDRVDPIPPVHPREDL